MDTGTDQALLKSYAERGDEAAFAAVVRAHMNLVYAVALRLVGGDAPLAEEVAQGVFTALARQAKALAGHATLVGWLHTTTRHLSNKAVRGERRRRAREHEAFTMQTNDATPEINWAQVQPVLDEAVGGLPAVDRDALLLRYFEGKSHLEVGAAIGVTEEAAWKRIDRALEKLRRQFARRGVTATAAILGEVMVQNTVPAAPAGLAARVTATSLADAGGTVAGGTLDFSLMALLMSTKNKILLAAVVLLLFALSTAIHWRGSPDLSATRAESAPVPAKLAAGAAIMAPAQVAAPVVKPAPASASPPAWSPLAGGSAPAPDPRVEVGTAMMDFAHLLEVGDYVTAANNYMQLPPDVSGQQLVDMMQQNPDFPKTVQMLRESTEAAQTTTPTYNDAGDEATYTLSPPVDDKVTVRWKRVNGLWMVDGYE
jgi:RNA polymerase sigma factor (sigma-70 family)